MIDRYSTGFVQEIARLDVGVVGIEGGEGFRVGDDGGRAAFSSLDAQAGVSECLPHAADGLREPFHDIVMSVRDVLRFPQVGFEVVEFESGRVGTRTGVESVAQFPLPGPHRLRFAAFVVEEMLVRRLGPFATFPQRQHVQSVMDRQRSEIVSGEGSQGGIEIEGGDHFAADGAGRDVAGPAFSPSRPTALRPRCR